jgi:LmbE family N-acetylglucosaminyl deacetylase
MEGAAVGLAAGQLLILAPHPDDEAIACGGLIAFARNRGCAVHVVVTAVGDCRQLGTGKTEPGPRLAELEAAGRAGGYSAEVLFVGDQFMRVDALPRKELCDRIEDKVQALRPDVVVVPPASSYDQDHRALAEAAVTALRPRPRDMRHFVPTVLECDEPYWWRVDGSRPTPTFFVPLTDEELEAKVRMVRCHASQDRADPFGRSTDNLRRYALTYGAEVGGGYAEAYRVLRSSAASLLPAAAGGGR